MSRFGKSVSKGRRYLLAGACTIFSFLFLLSCGEGRFDIGDKVGVPPLPPSDKIVGLFEKVQSSDLSGNVYKVKDIPESGVEQPVIVDYGGKHILYFYAGLGGDDSLLMNPRGSRLPGDVVVGPGPNSILETTAVFDDVIVDAIVPGKNGFIETGNDPNDIYIDPYIFAGPDGIIDSLPGGDDMYSKVMLAGPNGEADSPYAIKFGTLEEASLYIDTGPNGIAESGLGFDDRQVSPAGTVAPNPGDVLVVAAPGGNGIIDTPLVGDDVVTDAVLPGNNGARETTPQNDDAISVDGQYILPGVDGVLDTTLLFLGGDDELGKVIVAGTNEIAQSGLGAGDIQGTAVIVGKSYISFNGIRNGQGEPNRKAIDKGNDGKISTIPIYDDNTRFVPKPFLKPLSGESPTDITYYFSMMKIPQNNGIYTGPDGIAQSGLGGDDVQLVKAGNPVTPGGVIVKAGPDDGYLDTVPSGGDVQQVAPGTYTGNTDDVVVRPGKDGRLTTSPLGDDLVVVPTILSGGGKCDTKALGDDIQLVPVSSDQKHDGTSLENSPIISSGPNGVLDTIPKGDDWYLFLNNGDLLVAPTILAGVNKRADSIVTDDVPAIIDGIDGIAQSGIGGDDVQILGAGIVSGDIPLPAVTAGANGVLNTARLGDDVEMVYNFSWPPGSVNASTVVCGACDDIQVVPPGSAPWIPGPPSMPFIPIPIILPGPNGVIDSVVLGTDTLTITDYGLPAFWPTFVGMVTGAYGDFGISTYPAPNSNAKIDSGLAGRGVFDAMIGCATTNDNGSVPLVDDPFAGHPSYDQCFARIGQCNDDCQKISAGSPAAANAVIVHSGFDGALFTSKVGDDLQAIIDGGNGIAESGIGKDDKTIIKTLFGEPRTVSVLASRDPWTGQVRELNTTPSGDDKLVIPANAALSADRGFDPNNKETAEDPDGDTRVENYGTVDDGEYFSWVSTNINVHLVPIPDVSIPYDLAFISEIDPNAPYRVVNSVYSFDLLKAQDDPNRLISYISDGLNIYRTTSVDGETWSAPELVLEPGGAATSRDDSPVVLAGPDGICDTTADEDDIQKIEPTFGLPNTICIFAGKDGALQTKVRGDDFKDGSLIRTGPNGIAESIVGGDDWTVIPLGHGQSDAPCILSGKDGIRSTSDGAIANDDRPPFVDVDGDSATNILPELGEPYLPQDGYAGFDTFAVTNPSVFVKDGTYYMFYTGWGFIQEQEPKRPDENSFNMLGPCLRPGLDRRIDQTNMENVVNSDNDSSALFAPRIGVAISKDGKIWEKKTNPLVGVGNICTNLLDLSITAALGLDLSALGLSSFMANTMEFDYMGTMSAKVRSDTAADDEPVFSMIYTGLHFAMQNSSTSMGASLGALGALFAMMPDSNTGREPYGGLKTGVGLARSFNLTEGWEKLKANSPVFSKSMFYAPTSERDPAIYKFKDGYLAFITQGELGFSNLTNDDSNFFAFSTRYGTVYSMCTAARSVAATDSGRAAVGLILVMLPAIILITRKAWLKSRKK